MGANPSLEWGMLRQSQVRRVITMRRIIAAALVSLGICSANAIANIPEDANQKVGAMNNAFALDLYGHLADKQGNLLFSPTSIQTALAMTWAGARGQTAEQMARTLHLDQTPHAGEQLGSLLRDLNSGGAKSGYELSVANALWGLKAYPFLPAYLDTVEKNYGGHLAELDFTADPEGSRQAINQWVANQTRDKIQDLMPQGSITPATRLVLTNAIYMKGKWQQPFEHSQTHDADFFQSPSRKVTAPFMFQFSHFRYAEDADVQVLELPYGTGELAMRIFLPRRSDQLTALEHSLADSRFAELSGKLQRQEVRVWLPKFKTEASYHLEDVLPGMGIKLAFEPHQADFTGMTSQSQFFINTVIHKAYINTDEEGTEAAAATGVGMRATAIMAHPPEPKQFRADHPFVFAIVHQPSGAILFLGRLMSP